MKNADEIRNQTVKSNRYVKAPSQAFLLIFKVKHWDVKSKYQVLKCQLFYLPLKVVLIFWHPLIWFIQQLFGDYKFLLDKLAMVMFGIYSSCESGGNGIGDNSTVNYLDWICDGGAAIMEEVMRCAIIRLVVLIESIACWQPHD